MLGRWAALWRKDLGSQAWLLIGLNVGWIALAAFRWVQFSKSPTSLNLLQEIGRTNILFGLLISILLGNRLVVREYRAKTQLFVESLPLGRGEAVFAKFGFGFAIQWGMASLLLIAVFVSEAETSLTFIGIIFSKTLALILCSWSICFCLGLLGRLRWAAYFAGLLGVFAANTRGVNLLEFGPFALVNTQFFALERNQWPLTELLETLGLFTPFLALAWFLSRFHEGSVAELLARRASSQEKAGLWIVATLMATAVSQIEKDRPQRAFEFTTKPLLKSRNYDVEVMIGLDGLLAPGQGVLASLETLARDFERDFPQRTILPLRVSHNGQLEGSELRLATDALTSGILIEANLGATAFEPRSLTSYAAHEIFSNLSDGRAQYEPNHWFLDGFAESWTSSGFDTWRDKLWLESLAATHHTDLNAALWLKWEHTMQTLGASVSNSLSFTLLETLELRHGRQVVLDVAQSLLVQPTVSNGYDWFWADRADLPASLEQKMGESFEALIAAHRQRMQQQRRRFATTLEKLPDDRAEVSVQLTPIGGDIVYRLAGPALSRVRHCRLLHGDLPHFDFFMATQNLQREELNWPAGETEVAGKFSARYQTGQRFINIVECDVPELLHPLRLSATRLAVP